MKKIDFAKIKAIFDKETCTTCPFEKVCDTLVKNAEETLCSLIYKVGEMNGIYIDLTEEMNK